ncbi:MAG: hypothetical protein FWD79_10540 [Desulfobulbus sp.]|nr:hypothetical protein [Desulfobulbus sp.]
MEPIALIAEIKPPFSLPQTGEQYQRPPFTLGQLLQATVIAKGEVQLFTLDINGQHLLAESSSPLQIGQRLDLQLVALTPRMELQMVNQESANRWLGNVLPLLGKETLLLPQLTALADDTGLMEQLRPEVRETLFLFAGRQDAGGTSPPSLPVPALINQLADLLLQNTPSAPEHNAQIPQQEAVTLLQNAGRTASLNPEITAAASQLANLFSPEHAEQIGLAPDQSVASKIAGTEPKGTALALDFLTTLAQFKSTDSPPLLAQLLSLQHGYSSLPAAHPLQQLLSFLVQTTSAHAMPSLAQSAGEHLGELLNRLGLNMEQLLAGDRPDRATHTLKFALHELAQQAGAAADKGGTAPTQLGQLLELYQLIQHRLAGESLIFLPLPFLFLQQGYALIKSDQDDDETETANKHARRANRTVALHLQLEGLGNLQIDIRRREDKITVRFLAEDAEKAKFIAGFRQELEQWLTSGKLESVQFLIGAQAPSKSLLEKIIPDGAGMIDTRA